MNADLNKVQLNKRGVVHVDKRDDSRIYDKVGITINVLLDRGFKTAHQVASEVTIDISEGGLRFHDDWGLPNNALLEIVMTLANSDQRVLHYGQVRWKSPAADRDGFEIGVQFTEATREDRDAWLEYVRTRRDMTSTARLILKIDD